jgi:hypothetical protein
MERGISIQHMNLMLKGMGSILFLKNGLKKIAEKKNYKNHLRSTNYEVCTAVAHCFQIF